MQPAIAYYRVSTKAQGESRLGLEAQQEAVNRYITAHSIPLLAEFTEIETGTRKRKRPELEKALAACKQQKAILIIAKLDRLSRNVYFIASLLESKTPFIALDNPHADKLMFHLLAAFAEHESDRIRSRIKEALSAAKRRGIELGKHGKILAIQKKRQAQLFANHMKPILSKLHEAGNRTIRAKVAELNRQSIPSFRGGKWHLNSLHKVLHRINGID